MKAGTNSKQEMKKYNVQSLVRVCEASYDTEPFTKQGIRIIVRYFVLCAVALSL